MNIDNVEGHNFEYQCANALRRNGYRHVKVTQGSGDFGVDVIAYKNNCKYAIQVKNYSSHVGIRAVQEVYSGKGYYHCDKAAVMTNNYFTEAAEKAAKELGVELWDRNVTLRLFEGVNPVRYALTRKKRKNKKKHKILGRLSRRVKKLIIQCVGFACGVGSILMVAMYFDTYKEMVLKLLEKASELF